MTAYDQTMTEKLNTAKTFHSLAEDSVEIDLEAKCRTADALTVIASALTVIASALAARNANE